MTVLIAVGLFGCAQFAGSLFTLSTPELLPPDGMARGVSEAIAPVLRPRI